MPNTLPILMGSLRSAFRPSGDAVEQIVEHTQTPDVRVTKTAVNVNHFHINSAVYRNVATVPIGLGKTPPMHASRPI
jgi:hypothetical protein